ncbi:triple tyrosine motif-containing protein [Arcticibacter eurypsychrophilus]|uniref:triple tyrosine motif-containing protein n=1 Tax=Arcticibacter eurypsychrophilus TaxID=1434752 RepID=UPI00084DEE06|nr:triple tyrosine motif-containing protein [Arcticibacter eurypsychrophilus]
MRCIYLIIVLFSFSKLYAQNPIGIPQINTYSNLDYKGGTQNWDIDQDKNGILYFANNEGLLSFDGRHWKLYALPHRTIVRSVKIDAAGKIFVGAQDELGYFFPDQSGSLKFHSLKNRIPAKDRQFSDVWEIVIIMDEVFFRTTNKLFHLKDGLIKVYKPESSWQFIGKVNGKLYAQDMKKGLIVFENNSWQPTVFKANPIHDYITSILNYSTDTLLVTTLKSGLYLMGKNFFIRKESLYNQTFKNNRLYKAITVNNNLFAVATSSAGCYIMDKKGGIIQQFSSIEGLYKNNLRSIFMDKNRNLWLGLDDGINFIAFNNAIKYIYPDKEKQTSSYCSLIFNNSLYVGTSNGLFYNSLQVNNKDLSFSRQDFKQVANTTGQVWNMSEVNNKLLLGHEDGAFVIENNNAKQLYGSPGTWLFEPLSTSGPSSSIIAGTYTGLQSIDFSNNQFINKGQVKGLNEPLRFLIADKGVLWASHPYRGVYRMKLSSGRKRITETKLFTDKDGLPSSLGNYVAKIKNRIVIATTKGIYEFNDKTQRFAPSTFLGLIFKDNVYHYLKEDKVGNIWFVSYKRAGVVDFKKPSGNKKYTIVFFPELNAQVLAGFENIYPFDEENVFIGATRGLIHINYKKYIQNIKPINVTLSLIKVSGRKDSIIYGGYFLADNKIQSQQNAKESVELTHENNSLHLEYSSALYEQQNIIEFSYQLSGFDRDWSEWNSKSEKDYTNLPRGNYIFKVKARNNLGNESKTVTYSFSILPAWYESYWIYLCYFLVVIGIFNLLSQWQKRKHAKEQEYLKYQYQVKIERNENEIVRLKNEKLEAEVNFKNKELATTSMHLIQNNKLISKIKEELAPLLKDEENGAEELKKAIRLLNEAEKSTADWEQFAIHFDHVHSNFISKLKARFPNLSSNDLKLCAYLKINLSSKEMAQLMSITIRAVEVSRYRLRKKLQISSDTNLFDYLLQVTSQD